MSLILDGTNGITLPTNDGKLVGVATIHNATSKATPIDNDELAILDSATTFSLKKLTFADLKATLKTIPIIATGTATFTSTTNNINLTGIGIGVEIGDVIQISGAEDAKNNSEFTVEVITDNDNIIVNQAHANKGTTKNVANRASDAGVTIKLLAKWYNAPIGLGQDWVNLASNRSYNVIYTNNTGKPIQFVISMKGTTFVNIVIEGIQVARQDIGTGDRGALSFIVPNGATYMVDSSTTLNYWSELR